METKRLILYGVDGVMGRMVEKEVEKDPRYKLLYGVSPLGNVAGNRILKTLKGLEEDADLLIDFSHPGNLGDILDYAIRKGVPTLIATTGYDEDGLERIRKAGEQIPVLLASNTSFGISLLKTILSSISGQLEGSFDLEIVEKHHNKKLDAPSGTAKSLFEAATSGFGEAVDKLHGRGPESGKRQPNQVAIHSIRGGTYPGEHTVIFAGEDEIIEFKHTALSKRIFATGALTAGMKLCGKKPGLYSMEEL